MLKRQIFLFTLLKCLENANRLNKLTIMKLTFLIATEFSPSYSFYSFYPYLYGPFSMKVYTDLDYFQKIGWISEKKIKNKTSYEIHQVDQTDLKLNTKETTLINELIEKYPTLEDLMLYIYSVYPKYTINSKLKSQKKPTILPGYYLIGYEGRDIDAFLHVLIENNIQHVIDVRNNPRSMKFDFNKKRLETMLSKVNIRYSHIPELGIAKEGREHLQNQSDYENLFQQYANELPHLRPYLDQIIELGKSERICLMCFEKDLQMCHRREIGKYLGSKGIPVKSI